jgi:glutathione S-transferase
VTTALPSWQELEDWAAAAQPLGAPLDPGEARVQGPTNAQATLRLFGQTEAEVRVTLYRDHHAWCPYCQKVWLWLEEKRIPYRIRKVTMFCYGEKERWYRQLVPSGMLPALELDGRVITESDRILEELEAAFCPLVAGLNAPEVLPLRQLERLLFRAWCEWLCYPHRSEASDRQAQQRFQNLAELLEQALAATAGPFLLGELSVADLVFVPYVERMSASLAYYKGFVLRVAHPAIDRWFEGLEQRSTYLGTQSDFHTHVHDLPPQMGGCYANGSTRQRQLAARIHAGPWPILAAAAGNGPGDEPWLDRPDPETSQQAPADAAAVAVARVLRHRSTLLSRNPLGRECFDSALRATLAGLAWGDTLVPPEGSASGLRYLRDRISVPRDMPLHSGRALRQALEATALQDPADPLAQGPDLPQQHRRDQDPSPFLQARH